MKGVLERINNGEDLHLPLNDRMYHILNDFMYDHRYDGSDCVFNSPKLRNRPVSAAEVRVKIKTIARLAGINKRVTPHIIRHCTTTHLTLLDVDQKYISNILGHADTLLTARYQHLNVENLRPVVNKRYNRLLKIAKKRTNFEVLKLVLVNCIID